MKDMKILSISITEFGGLKDFNLSFSDGLNIIRGDNEAGKSTVLLFIMYMLYGLTRKSAKNNDKDKSLSWSGARAEGSMEIECDGRHYRIERANARRTISSEATITDIDAGKRIDTQDEPGVFFLGLSKEAFESCVWCGQTRVTSINGTGVSEALSNLSLTADESVNGDAVIKAIEKVRKVYRHKTGGGGLISETEQARAQAELDASGLQYSVERLAELKIKRNELAAETERAEKEMNRAKEIRDAASTVRVLMRINDLKKLRADIEKDRMALDELTKNANFGGLDPTDSDLSELRYLEKELSRRTEEYDNCIKNGNRASEANADAVAVARKISERESADAFCQRIDGRLASAAKKRILGVSSAAVALLCAVAGIFLPVLFAATAVFGALAAAMLVIQSKEIKQVEAELNSLGTSKDGYKDFIRYCFEQLGIYDSEKELLKESERNEVTALSNMTLAKDKIEEKLAQYGRSGGNIVTRLSELIGEVEDYINKKKALTDKIRTDSGIADLEESRLATYDEEKLRRSLPDGVSESVYIDENEATRAFNEVFNAYNDAKDKLTQTDAEIKALSDCEEKFADIQRDIDSYNTQIDEYTEKYNVLDTAVSAVREAYDNMKSNFAPKVRESAGEYLEAISDGKYSKVLLSESMDVSVDASGKEREAANLSGGTADAVYISLRFALVKQIFEGTVPFFMDESLSQLDDTRAGAVLQLINTFVDEGNQCMLFSCHHREANICDTLNINYNKIEM
ncbi:MAG: AAA family ATPase [Clostridia bacterium]|nr:AAA family ATPase [Clostridia bacterium]